MRDREAVHNRFLGPLGTEFSGLKSQKTPSLFGLNHNLTFSKDTEFEMCRLDVTEDEIRQIEIIN